MMYSDYRYQLNSRTEGFKKNWLFLPGGPGLGSDYLIEFCDQLQLPGNKIIADFPKDGRNCEGKLNFSFWAKGLIQLLQTLHKPILVTHSFSGMFALSLPEIEPCLSGLVLMNTTSTNSFFQHVNAMKDKHNLPDLVPPATEYHLKPSNETYKLFWETYKYYCFTPEEMNLGEKMMDSFAFNNESYHYAIENFYPNYHCKWHPSTLPTLIITSEKDYICPPHIFEQDKHFQGKNVMHKIIRNAGHCPWIKYPDKVQECFNEFSSQFST
ncbi:alpha/beta fold hydrolase [Legionella waltersii]|uniref:Hydrolases or acyltransferases (Alpha/beta hydrolase superfamily) n=1 Tax=Legionella waltersii TaxID=66969 RepID=A0A0W1AGN8_9GAMM|nr:alpha/beta hydrolase [Legionella waltersii]KTD80491.1 hydrolases or acyltransferases (alpha/beta hydrolase superfamily) [Legionella waltersii]SNV09694.1 hydrolases or acyltransferases (alpha/beta hydrolase superfamily) [Legionella waltersii]